MNIVYIITTILLFVAFILMPKKEEKQNIIFSVIISVIMYLAYNIFINLIIYALHLKATLLTLSITNLIFACILSTKTVKEKKIQKYYLNKVDLIAVIIILITTIGVAIYNYGPNIKLKHGVTDASTHYFVAHDYYKYSTLTSRENSDKINWLGISNFMAGAYINTGIFLKLFEGIVSETYLCKVFFVFDALIWILSGLLMYTLLAMNNKKIKYKIIAAVFSLFYVFAYQFNSLLLGFSYLGVGLDIIIGIMIVMKADIGRKYKNIGLFLLNLGIMFTYYYFAPIIFLAVFWQILNDNKEEGNKLFDLKNIWNVLITLVIPGLIGVFYFIILPHLKADGAIDYVGAIGIDGFIYKNLITNILPYLLFGEIYLIYNFIKKKNLFLDKMLYLSIIFFLITFWGRYFAIISDYYFYKIYYMLYIILVDSAFETLKLIMDKNKKIEIFSYILLAIYSAGIIYTLPSGKNLFVFDIYLQNFNELKTDYTLIEDGELEILEYYNDNINNPELEEPNTYFCKTRGLNGRHRWIYSLTNNSENFYDAASCIVIGNLQLYAESNKEYAVIFKIDYAGEYDKIDEEIEKYNLKIIMQNDDGIILQKQNLTE